MKSIMITGAGSGLGQELATLYSEYGYHTILLGRDEMKLSAVAEAIPSATIATVDIRDRHAVEPLVQVLAETHDLAGLINNAGVGYFGPFTAMQPEEMEEMIQTNLFGTIHMSQAVLPLIADKPDSFLMNIISTAGLRGKVNESVYVASKFAVRGLTESLQKEYEARPVHISAVYMGGMNTPFWQNSTHVTDPSSFRAAKEVAEIIYTNRHKSEVIIESKK